MECTDKKLLLDHFIARAGSPAFASVPADITGIEFYSVANTPDTNRNRSIENGTPDDSFRIESDNSKRQRNNSASEDSIRQVKNKRRGICSPTELGLRLAKSQDEDFCQENGTVNLSPPKRRDVPPRNLPEEAKPTREDREGKTVADFRSASDGSSESGRAVDPSEGKTSSESVDLELDVSFSDVDSLDIDEFNENIVQKLCLSTLKSIKNGRQDADIRNIQKIALEILRNLRDNGGIGDSEAGSVAGRELETPSEALSAHDYENICAVNIAREAWGLRSWRACPDMGGSPLPAPPPLPARRPVPSQSVTHLPEPPPRPPPVDSRFKERTVEGAQFYPINSNMRVRSPPLPLESVPEEVDEFTDGDPARRSRRRDSESTLVATIDEIRNDTPADSPRNVYHRPPWDSPLSIVDRVPPGSRDLRRRLWKEHSIDTDVLDDISIPPISFVRESVEIVSNRPEMIIDSRTKNFITSQKDEPVAKPAGDLENKIKFDQVNDKNWMDIPKVQYHKRISKRPSPIRKPPPDKNTLDPPADLHYDEVIFVPQPSKDNFLTSRRGHIPAASVIEDVANGNLTSSLQSLIERDKLGEIAVPKNSEAARPMSKKSDGRPRRKFSLLRERFEPKSKHSDEEKLFQSLESVRSVSCDGSSQNLSKIDRPLILNEPKIVDKENLTPSDRLPSEESRDSSGRTVTLSLVPCDISQRIENTSVNLKEKRTMFLKQVLSPPKISSRNKKL